MTRLLALLIGIAFFLSPTLLHSQQPVNPSIAPPDPAATTYKLDLITTSDKQLFSRSEIERSMRKAAD